MKVTFKESIYLIFILLVVLIGGIGVLRIDLHVVLLMSLFICIMWAYIKGCSWQFIRNSMSKSIERAFDAMLIFILIGATIGVWIQSGTVPALIYYGLNMLSPKIFLPAGLIICSITSVITGTSWGTVATVGIALIGIGESLGIPLGLTAGMIVSGAFFGDKISPMSDTTNLAAAATDTNLYDHIGSMMYTTVPSYILAFIVYSLVGLRYGSGSIDFSQIALIKNTLNETFNLTPFVIIPMIVVIILSIKKKPAVPTMSIGIALGVLISCIFQRSSFKNVLKIINYGYTKSSGVKIVDSLLIRGGIQSMMWTFSLAFIALCLGGILDETGCLKVLIDKILKKVKSTGTLVFITILSLILSNLVMGEAYISIILNGKLYKEAYEGRNIKSNVLSRTLEEGGTLTTALIPWTTAGAFVASTLGVKTITYLPYTFFNLINPIVGIICAYLGICIFKNSNS